MVSSALEARTSNADIDTASTLRLKSATASPSPTTTDIVCEEYPIKEAVTSYVPAGTSLIR